jgi:hypothetical protein
MEFFKTYGLFVANKKLQRYQTFKKSIFMNEKFFMDEKRMIKFTSKAFKIKR